MDRLHSPLRSIRSLPIIEMDMNCGHRARALVCATVALALFHANTPALAVDPNGFPLCTAAGDQLSPVIVSDGAGGVIVAWHDHRPTEAAGGVTFAQRVGADGEPQWTADGVALSTTGDPGASTAARPAEPAIVADGAGGAFVAYGGGTAPPRVQWVNAAGAPQWGPDGVQLSVDAQARDLAIARDLNGAGGVIVAWRQDNGGAGLSDIYAQKVSAAGATQWGPSAKAVTASGTNGETLPSLISDNAGGAIIVWFLGGGGVRARRLDASGTFVWGTPSNVSAFSNANPPATVSDGSGGIVIAWSGGGGTGILVQRLSPDGAKQWGSNGVPIAIGGNFVTMIGDGAGGATLTWQDNRSGTNYNIYAQRMSATGIPQWIENGAEVCFETDDQLYPTIASDGGTGAIITWFDARSHPTGDDIYAQRIEAAAGAQQWTPNGVPVCTAANNQEYPTIAAAGAGGAFVTWQDHRGADYDIYLHRINPDGAIVSVPSGEAGSMVRGRAWPDPFFDRVQMEFALAAAIPVRMEVIDIRGRRVWDSGTTTLSAGTHVLEWDGRTSDGRRAADGIYFLHVKGPGLAMSRSVVRLK